MSPNIQFFHPKYVFLLSMDKVPLLLKKFISILKDFIFKLFMELLFGVYSTYEDAKKVAELLKPADVRIKEEIEVHPLSISGKKAEGEIKQKIIEKLKEFSEILNDEELFFKKLEEKDKMFLSCLLTLMVQNKIENPEDIDENEIYEYVEDKNVENMFLFEKYEKFYSIYINVESYPTFMIIEEILLNLPKNKYELEEFKKIIIEKLREQKQILRAGSIDIILEILEKMKWIKIKDNIVKITI